MVLGALNLVRRFASCCVSSRLHRRWRQVFLLFLFLFAGGSDDLRFLLFQVMSDAFLQVTVFVAATLALVYAFEIFFGRDLGEMLKRSRYWQPLIVALLGAMPGCGGAILVVTQYTRGYVTFGSVVSVLVATMGDAAFLLLAREPVTGMIVMIVSIVTAVLSGLVIDALHGPLFMRQSVHVAARPTDTCQPVEAESWIKYWQSLWVGVILAGFFIGVALHLQLDPRAWLMAVTTFDVVGWLSVAGTVLALVMWASSRFGNTQYALCAMKTESYPFVARVIIDTNFVTGWVVIGFLSYELAVYAFGSGIEAALPVRGSSWVPFMAILIGFLPGCGPQILVTSLYLNGVIPFSAQLGNSIANDGDALFPAIALAPRAAMLATIYSAIPAFILAYGYYILFE